MRGELTRVIDENASGGYANAVRVGFLWAKIYHHLGICYHLVLGDLRNVVVSHDKNGICNSTKIFAKGR
jgi:hypothetical protein